MDADVETLGRLGIGAKQRADPVSGRFHAQIARGDRTTIEAAGFTALDAADYLFGVLHTVLRRTASLFLDLDITRRLVDSLEASSPDLVAQTVPEPCRGSSSPMFCGALWRRRSVSAI